MKRKQAVSSGFAERLRSLRKSRDLSQADLSRQTGLHYTLLSRYERGITGPTADALRRLADALGVSSDHLLQGAAEDQALVQRQDLLRRFKALEKLPSEDQATLLRVMDAFLVRRQLEAVLNDPTQ